MEFPFNLNHLIGSEITKFDKNLVPFRKNADGYDAAQLRGQLCTVIDKIGDASAKAQGLRGTITTGRKLELSDHILYMIKDSTACGGKGAAVGLLKVGHKKLFVHDRHGGHHELDPLCVLDFYVHESRQRMGCGKMLFEYMLRDLGIKPQHCAIDKPSFKFSQFLQKHYNLKTVIPQVNNFVVFEGFFTGRPDMNNKRSRFGNRPPVYPTSNYNDDVIIRNGSRVSSGQYGHRVNSRPPSGSYRSNNRPPSGSYRSNNRPPSGSYHDNNRPPSGSYHDNGQPPSGALYQTNNRPSSGQISSRSTKGHQALADEVSLASDWQKYHLPPYGSFSYNFSPQGMSKDLNPKPQTYQREPRNLIHRTDLLEIPLIQQLNIQVGQRQNMESEIVQQDLDRSLHLALQSLPPSGTNRALGAAANRYSRHADTPPEVNSRPSSGQCLNIDRYSRVVPTGSRTGAGSRSNSLNRNKNSPEPHLRSDSPPMLQREGPPRGYMDNFNLHQDYQGRAGHLKINGTSDKVTSLPSINQNQTNIYSNSTYADRYSPWRAVTSWNATNWNVHGIQNNHQSIGAKHYSHTRLW